MIKFREILQEIGINTPGKVKIIPINGIYRLKDNKSNIPMFDGDDEDSRCKVPNHFYIYDSSFKFINQNIQRFFKLWNNSDGIHIISKENIQIVNETT